MCRPTHFTADYSIDPWMNPAVPTSTETGLAQWKRLHDPLVGLGHDAELIPPDPGLPDMVFAANGAVSDGRHVVLARAARRLAGQLRDRGFEPIGVDLSELLKAGGVKCRTLALRPAEPPSPTRGAGG